MQGSACSRSNSPVAAGGGPPPVAPDPDRARAERGIVCALLVLVALAAFAPPLGAAQGEEPDGNIVWVKRDRALELKVRRAEELGGAGRWEEAARAWLEVLRASSAAPQGVQPLVALEEGQRWTAAGRYARERLSALPPEGIAAFRALADGEAQALYERARAHRDEVALEELWRALPVSSYAAPALELLGDLALERGAAELAAERYRQAGAVPQAGLDPGRLARKLAAAQRLAGNARARAAARRAVQAPAPWAGAVLGLHPPAPAALGAPEFSHALAPSRAGRLWAQGEQSRGLVLPRRGAGEFADIVPALAGDRLVVTNGRAIACWSLQQRRELWRQSPWPDDEHNPHLFYGATIAEGRVFAPFVHEVSRAEYYRGIPIKTEIPRRRLIAFDLHSGKRLWDHAAAPDLLLRRASVALPPAVVGGRLYAGAVVRDKAIKCYLICADAATGRLVWQRYLGAGQVEMTMFGEHAIEPLAMMPVVRGGTVYHATGIGLFAAVSATTGEIEWLVRYRAIPIETPRTYYAILRELVWRNTPPVVTEDAVVVAPIDSPRAYAFRRCDGATLWWHQPAERGRLVGVEGGRAVFAGEDGVLVLEVASGKRVLAIRQLRPPAAAEGGSFGGGPMGEEIAGAPALGGGELLLPFADAIGRLDLQTGSRLPAWRLTGGIEHSGTVVLTREYLVTANPARVTVFRLAAPAPVR
ncbi:MAG: hypothetical protein KatS3mg102_1888 [Planctomycetota bacterium]|nr:MAG: hypothetical protein KatS3mg102_1888 [Planctomycetota bacterium]